MHAPAIRESAKAPVLCNNKSWHRVSPADYRDPRISLAGGHLDQLVERDVLGKSLYFGAVDHDLAAGDVVEIKNVAYKL